MNIEINGMTYKVELVKTGQDRVLLKLNDWNVLAIDSAGLFLHNGLGRSGLPIDDKARLMHKYGGKSAFEYEE